ncbi:hypothetical protein Cni_G24366 [Canna indica]|uniref:Late embryogenesis abundant protein LEA-2 subgroup domain-containing protein n=1 Tax=Canna indica TaxID=4628 RepID=A0AAQ3QPH6_9LILI|nr:hypothetical protein Cni_G24366 [Canna indica]
MEAGAHADHLAPRKPMLRFQPMAPRPTHPTAWLLAACCAVLWVAIILGGIAILVVYLAFRPRYPRLEIAGVTLNGAYLDAGTLLNADITILANFSNPNEKVDVSYSYMQLDLYFHGAMIATQAVEPFDEQRGQAVLRSVHMMSSQVPLTPAAAKAWSDGTMGQGVAMEVVGSFRTKSVLAGWMHYTYWLHRHCKIAVGAPPNGALLSSSCAAKR